VALPGIALVGRVFWIILTTSFLCWHLVKTGYKFIDEYFVLYSSGFHFVKDTARHRKKAKLVEIKELRENLF
jgi:hypothetical protein